MLWSKFYDFWHEFLPKLETIQRWLGLEPKPFPHHFRSIWYCCFLSMWLQNVPSKILWRFGTKTSQSCKSNQNDLVFPHETSECPILGQFVVGWHKSGLQVKISWLFLARKPPMLTKLQTNPRWLGFALKPSLHTFWSISYCFPPVRLKNVSVKILWLLSQKLAEVANQPKMTWFCTQTAPSSILINLLLFLAIQLKSISVKILWLLARKLAKVWNHPKWLGFAPKTTGHPLWGWLVVVWHKRGPRKLQVKICWLFQTPKPSKLAKLQTNTRWLGFAPEPSPHTFWSIFLIVFHQYDSKIFRSIFHDFWHQNPSKLQTNKRWLGFAPKPSPHHFWIVYFCFPSMWLKNIPVKIFW